MLPPRIVIATSNTHKVDELRQLAERAGADTTLVAWNEVDTPFDIDETGHTFEENAYIKALAVYEQTGLPVIADDSGLEVDALHGAPGVYSARYSGPNATDASNRAKLLAALAETRTTTPTPDIAASTDRTASFRCVLCYTDGQRTVFGEGSVKGLLATSERGKHGFGYDALFVPDGDMHTFGEMTADDKHMYSHRSKAFTSLMNNMTSSMSSSPPQRLFLMQAAIAAVRNNEALLRSATRNAVTTTQDATCVYEAVLQTYLFAGYPAALDGLVVVVDECSKILGSPLPDHSEPFDVQVFRDRGTKLCKVVYGNVYDKLMARLEEVSPDLREWMIVEGYGKTLSRPGLDIVTRELCVVAVLAATERNTQLYSHVRGALLAGATEEDLALCIDVVTEYVSAHHADAIRSITEPRCKDSHTIMESVSI